MKNRIQSLVLTGFTWLVSFSPAFSQVNPADAINPDLPDVFAPPPVQGPNLVVSRMAITALSATSITVSFQILNAGNEDANLYRVAAQFSANGNRKKSTSLGSTFLNGISSLAPGETHTQDFKATFPAGAYTSLCVMIDAENILHETQEGDNDLCTRNWLRGSSGTNTDLRSSPSIAGGSDLGVFQRPSAPGKVFFQIRNIGPVEAVANTTRVVFGNPQNKDIRNIDLDTPAVPPYGTVTLSFTFPDYQCDENYFVDAQIDVHLVVPETDDDNNYSQTKRCSE